MIVNLRNTPANSPLQNNFTSSSANFLKKNKITVNQVAQTHFTVEGVQSFTADQLKALKLKQDKNFQNKEGVFVQPKTYKVSDDLQNQKNQEQEAKQRKINLMINSILKNNSKTKQTDLKESKVKELVKPLKQNSAKQKHQMNNNVLTKLSKQMNKKNALEEKLHKLSKKYKKIFGDKKQQEEQNQQNHQEQQQEESQRSSLCQSIMSINKNKNKGNVSGEQHNKDEEQMNSSRKKSKLTKKNKPSTAANSKKMNQKKFGESSSKISEGSQDYSQFNEDNEQNGGNKNNLVRKSMKNKSSYSQKLGTAVHSLFQ